MSVCPDQRLLLWGGMLRPRSRSSTSWPLFYFTRGKARWQYSVLAFASAVGGRFIASLVARRTRSQHLPTPFPSPPAAPEILQTESRKAGVYDKSCDAWSLGVILYILYACAGAFGAALGRDMQVCSVRCRCPCATQYTSALTTPMGPLFLQALRVPAVLQ